MEECVFCKIINGQLASYKVYEDDDFVAILDIRPLNPGHTLVIPKKHIKRVWDVEDIGSYYEVVKKLVNGLRKTFDTERIVSLVFGEEVDHAHVWLIPRFDDDGHGGAINLTNIKTIDTDQMKSIAEKINKNI